MVDRLPDFIRRLAIQGRWIRQFIVISGFYFFDYISTSFFCQHPNDEWNIIARTFMITSKSVPIGMTMFFLMISVMWYSIIYMMQAWVGFFEKKGMHSFIRLFNLSNFIVFAFIAGWDFGFGATSWFWNAPIFYRALVGSLLYMAIHFFWIDRGRLSLSKKRETGSASTACKGY